MDKKPVSVLQVNTLDCKGGAAKIAFDLFVSLNQYGIECKFAVGEKRLDNLDIHQIPNNNNRSFSYHLFWKVSKIIKKIPVFRILTKTYSICKPLQDLYNLLGIEDYNYPGTAHLINFIPNFYPDIIHCHNLHGGYFDIRYIPSIGKKIPIIITLHDAWLLSGYCHHSFDCERWKIGCGMCPHIWKYPEIHHDATAYNWRKKKQIYENSRLFVITPCQWLMNKVNKSILKQGTITARVIPNGVNLKIFHPITKKVARTKLDLPVDCKILLFVAYGIKNSPWKDYNLLYSVIEKLVAYGQSVLCLALGEEGSLVSISGSEIMFVPYHTDPEKVALYYQAADVYIHPAKAETFPNTILESLACGTPVVASNIGGIPEQIIEGVTGFLVPPGDSQLMANRVIQLLENDEYRQKIGRNAATDAKQRFGLERMVEEYSKFYMEVLEM